MVRAYSRYEVCLGLLDEVAMDLDVDAEDENDDCRQQ
jgi:hypothetical protein